ncbi:hypothetical protein [Amycolatopsis acidicola]|uniref:hypothetical protein n=1 Tax=Amycolatopsis acidicola TaxID=2596893 RepID=UPI001FB71E83|nr:hypothetical protein [Amycolatopsis acidicola]
MILGERAAALAEAAGSDELWVRAESLVVAARVRLGLRAETVGRAVAVLRAAEDLGDAVLAAGLRTDLALCARSVGVPLTGLAALRPVLDVAEFSGAGKAAALCQLVGCLSQFGRKPEVDRALNEADQLCNGDDTLEGDGRLLTRALVRVGVSAHRRRHSDVLGAADAARTGLGLLEQLDDPSCDGGVVRIRLILQLVCSLLDRGDSKNALEIAQPVLDEPVRPASVAPVGWLRMAVATRILLPAGSVEAAAVMLRDGVHSTERHGLPGLATRLWGELAHVEERLGRPTEAINALRESRAAEHVYTRARRQAVGLLSGEFGNGGHAAVDLDDILGATPQSGAPLAGPAAAAAPAAEVKLAPVRAEASAENRFVVREEPSSGTRETAAEHTAAAHKTQHAGSAAAASAGEGVSEASSHAEERDTPSVARRNGSDAREIKLAPVTVAPPVPPDLPLAPAPADEPSPRISVVSDAVPASSHVNGFGRNGSANGERVLRLGRDTVFAPHGANGVAGSASQTGTAAHLSADQAERSGADRVERSGADQAGHPGSGDRVAADGVDMAGAATDSAAGRAAVESFDAPGRTAGTERDARSERSRRKTRHDSAHGSVAARSVLDRLGVSAGAGGGRRRATTDPEAAAAADVSTADRATADQANAGTANAGTVNTSAADTSAADTSAADTSAAASGGAAADVAAGAETAAATSDTAATGTTAIGATGSDTAAADAAVADTEATASTPDSNADSADGTNAEASGAGSAQDTGAENAEAPGAGSAEDSGAGSAESSGAENAEASRAERAENSASGASNTEELPGSSLNENWLPRLRLPPSLEPFEDFGEELPSSTSETHFTSTPVIEDDGLGEPFRVERSHPSTMDDDLPPDAGLADLLARALAEHQAGTSSAAALVKRLENQGAGDPRPVNGHGRNGEVPGNGRHRTDG